MIAVTDTPAQGLVVTACRASPCLKISDSAVKTSSTTLPVLVRPTDSINETTSAVLTSRAGTLPSPGQITLSICWRRCFTVLAASVGNTFAM